MTTTALLAGASLVGLSATAASAEELPADPAQTTMTWNVRDSFLNYVNGPIAHGSVVTSGNLTSEKPFTWSQGTGTVDAEAGNASVAFDAAIHFSGHDYGNGPILDLQFSNVSVDTAAGMITADVQGREFVDTVTLGPWFEVENVTLGTITDGSWDGEVYTGTPELTAEGASAFGGFYSEGEALAPIALTAVGAEPVEPEPTEPEPTDPEPTDPEPTDPAPVDPTEGDDAQLQWGVKESFINYLSSPWSGGNWTLYGVSELKDPFAFLWNNGVVEQGDGTTAVSYEGSLHFSAHESMLDVQIINPTVVVSIDGSGELRADLKSEPTSGSTIDQRDVVLADLVDIEWTGETTFIAGTEISADAAALFGSSYSEGQEFDPLTVRNAPQPVEQPVDPEPTDPEPTDPEPTDPVEEQAGWEFVWGVKESFRNYVTGPIAHGEITTDGVGVTQDGQFIWSDGDATESNTKTEVAFSGTVKFVGHDGILELTISNPRIVANANGSGAVYADVVSRPFTDTTTKNDPVHYNNVKLVTFTNGEWSDAAANGSKKLLAAAANSDDTRAFSSSSVVLTTDGAKAFGGFYEAGVEFDALTLNSAPVAEPDPDGGDNNGGDNDNNSGSSPEPNAPGQNNGTGEQQETCVANELSGTLDWGIKESFRNYIQGGIAKGDWALSGVSETSNGFQWSGSGQLNTDAVLGEVSLPGTVHFTGHDGVLDTKITGMRLVIHSSTLATIYADVASHDMDGTKHDLPGVAFATVNLTGASLTADSFSVNGASATLTDAGAEAFAGFYEGGIELDPVSFAFTVGVEVPCSAAANPNGSGGTLAQTGIKLAPLHMIALAMLLIAAGVATTAGVRRNRA